MSFDADAYWENRSPKKYVVKLVAGERSDTLVVSADDEETAIDTAINHSMLPTDELEVAEARLATPADLGLDVVGESRKECGMRSRARVRVPWGMAPESVWG